MKGFKKDGKFIPTSNRKKSSLKKSDVGRQEIEIKKYVPIEERKKESLSASARLDKTNHKNDMDIEIKHLEDEIQFMHDENKRILQNPKRYSLSERNASDIVDKAKDEIRELDEQLEIKKDERKELESRDKETIGSHAGHPLVIEDNGKLYEEFNDHAEEVFKQPQAKDQHMNKFSLFGDKKSDQAKASEDKIKAGKKEEHREMKVDETQDKNNQKRAKEIAKHIKFLEKHIEGLEKKPAKFGVNANTQLENIQESRNQKRELQAELDEINKIVEKPVERHKKGNRTIGKFTNVEHREEMNEILPPHAEEYTGRDKESLDITEKKAKERKLTNYLEHARTQEIPISKKETELFNLRKSLGMNPTWGE